MDRFQQIDATNSSIGALLLPDEEVLSLQAGIGLYDGREKSLDQASGTVYLTSHRLLYVDDLNPHRHSCALDLSLVKQTEYYAGFLKSSPKITLAFDPKVEAPEQTHHLVGSDRFTHSPRLSPRPSSRSLRPEATVAAASSSTSRDWRTSAAAADFGASAASTSSQWICNICGFSNTSGASVDAAKDTCQLCGVTRDPTSKTATTLASRIADTNSGGRKSTSDRSAQIEETGVSALAISDDSGGSTAASGDGHACPTCTFLNHPSMVRCEMCGSLIGTEDVSDAASTSAATTKRGSLSAPATPARKSSDTDATSISSRMPSRSQTPKPKTEASNDSVKLSFRKGGDKAFYTALKGTLKSKAWLLAARRDAPIGSGVLSGASTPSRSAAAAVDLDGRGTGASKRKAGIDGILKVVDSSSRVQSDDMQGALKDLEALMAKAKQMVEFAEALNSKLTRQEQAAAAAAAARSAGDGAAAASPPPPLPDAEAATLIRSSLVRLGLPAPAVTEDMARDQAEYHMELARELGGLLLGSQGAPGLMGRGSVLAQGKARESLARMPETERGLLGLDEIWCVWNRARGIALVPPQALRSASLYLPDLTSPSIQLKTFDSGLAVLHTPRYSENAFAARLVGYLDAVEDEHRRRSPATPGTAQEWGPGLSTLEIAERENAPVLLVTELVEMVEIKSGLVVRDQARSGVRWYFNHFARAR
ncbi:related to VPS36 protein, involved in vacuolar protein sorting [Pseudozyma flocculosa]|uniref:Vacuolar protein-sorting-associated protein 36 n=1 Tax=Pseudozyma flocculosa TaxID=84751 RepID=A0A5C3EUZ0_9BASI|nr:related to VPS36 protein, involved in vacuolar protein sorting [Pseudozyma flocculosa]